MTPSEVEKLAREASASGSSDELSGDAITRFAELIERAAMEKAAKICDDIGAEYLYTDPPLAATFIRAIRAAAQKEA